MERTLSLTKQYDASECHQIYESEVQRCDLAKDCCAEYAECRRAFEQRAKLPDRERLIIKNFNKCSRFSSNQTNESLSVSIESKAVEFKDEAIPSEVVSEIPKTLEHESIVTSATFGLENATLSEREKQREETWIRNERRWRIELRDRLKEERKKMEEELSSRRELIKFKN